MTFYVFLYSQQTCELTEYRFDIGPASQTVEQH